MQVGDLCIHVGVGDGTRRQNPLIDSLDVAKATYDYIKLPVDPDRNGGWTTGNVDPALESDDEGWVERVVHLIGNARLHLRDPLESIILGAPIIVRESPCKGSRVPESIWNTCSSENALNSTRLVLKQRLRHERRVRLNIRRFLNETSIGLLTIALGWIEHLQGTVAVPCSVQLELTSCGEGVRN